MKGRNFISTKTLKQARTRNTRHFSCTLILSLEIRTGFVCMLVQRVQKVGRFTCKMQNEAALANFGKSRFSHIRREYVATCIPRSTTCTVFSCKRVIPRLQLHLKSEQKMRVLSMMNFTHRAMESSR